MNVLTLINVLTTLLTTQPAGTAIALRDFDLQCYNATTQAAEPLETFETQWNTGVIVLYPVGSVPPPPVPVP